MVSFSHEHRIKFEQFFPFNYTMGYWYYDQVVRDKVKTFNKDFFILLDLQFTTNFAFEVAFFPAIIIKIVTLVSLLVLMLRFHMLFKIVFARKFSFTN